MTHRIRPFITLILAACLVPGCFGLTFEGKEAANTAPPARKPDQAETWQSKPATPNHLALAQKLVKKKFYTVALGQLNTAIDNGSDDVRVYDLAGVCARETGDYKAAADYLKKAAALAPEDASVHNNLGLLHAQCQESGKARTAFETAVRLDPGRADFINNLGYLHLTQKDYPQAESLFRQALALSPGFDAVINNLVLALGMQHKDGPAMDLLLAHYDTGTAWHNMAAIYDMRKEPDKARRLRELTGDHQVHTAKSAFDIQTLSPGQAPPPTAATGLSGEMADLIYTSKYKKAIKSDPSSTSSGIGQ